MVDPNYHEAFWIVAGTAAPVIILSDIVALTDLVRAYFAYYDRLAYYRVKDPQTKLKDWQMGALTIAPTISGVCVLTSAFFCLLMLGASLNTLAAGHDPYALGISKQAIVFAVLFLLVGSVLAVLFRVLQGRWLPGKDDDKSITTLSDE